MKKKEKIFTYTLNELKELDRNFLEERFMNLQNVVKTANEIIEEYQNLCEKYQKNIINKAIEKIENSYCDCGNPLTDFKTTQDLLKILKGE